MLFQLRSTAPYLYFDSAQHLAGEIRTSRRHSDVPKDTEWLYSVLVVSGQQLRISLIRDGLVL